jgi:hypothetical protein
MPLAQGDPAADAAAVRLLVEHFVAAEAAMDESADTLLAPGAGFVAMGIPATRRPRLAGMLERGLGALEESSVEVSGGIAWAAIIYRWTPRSPGQPEIARATMVLVRLPAGWRIRHVHSSWVEPW